MTPEQRANLEKLAGLVSAETVAAENHLQKAVRRMGKAVAIADEVAGDNRIGPDAKFALRARAHMERLKAAHASIKASHAEASILQCEALEVPMARGGER